MSGLTALGGLAVAWAVAACAAAIWMAYRVYHPRSAPRAETPESLDMPFEVHAIRVDGARPPRPPGATAGSFVWKRRIPYFYCHFMDRLQHSGYVRLMEEVVDLFLAERGISIRAMLERRSWIPVVAEAGLEILREARLEEEICTVFTVRHVYKGRLYSAALDWYVARGAEWVQTARGRIVHGYAQIPQRGVMKLVPLDVPVLDALGGGTR